MFIFRMHIRCYCCDAVNINHKYVKRVPYFLLFLLPSLLLSSSSSSFRFRFSGIVVTGIVVVVGIGTGTGTGTDTANVVVVLINNPVLILSLVLRAMFSLFSAEDDTSFCSISGCLRKKK